MPRALPGSSSIASIPGRSAGFLQRHVDQPGDRDGWARGGARGRRAAEAIPRRRHPRRRGVARARGAPAGDGSSIRSTAPTNYTHGLPVYSVGIGLERGRASWSSASSTIPRATRCSSAERGAGAWLNDTRLSVSATAALGREPAHHRVSVRRATNPDNNLREYATFAVRRAGAVRRHGAPPSSTSRTSRAAASTASGS
jgi:hypothetical protein